MNSDQLLQLLQTGFRLSVGATATLIESLQDSQKRAEILSLLMQSEFSQLAEELAKKGEITEQEAREFVDSLWHQRNNQTSSDTPGASGTTTKHNQAAPPNVQQDLQELTAQIAALRAELEKLRTQDPQS